MRLLLITTFSLILASVCYSQTDKPVCISQNAANTCAANTRELAAIQEKVAILEVALIEKDKSISELKEANRKNIEDLTGQLMKITAEAAQERGQRVQLENDKVFWAEIIKIAIQNTRQKTNGIKIF